MRIIGWGLVFVVGCSSAGGNETGQHCPCVSDAGQETHDAGNVLDAAADASEGGAVGHDSGPIVDAGVKETSTGNPNFGRPCPSSLDNCDQLPDGLCEDGYTSSLGAEEHGTCTITCGGIGELSCEEAGAPAGATCEGPDTKGRHVCIPH